MNIVRSVATVAVGAVLLAGCGRAQQASKATPPAPIVDFVTTTTQAESTTTTTACISNSAPQALTAAKQALQSDQATLDTNVAGQRQIAGAVADIQLTIDNTGRQIEIEQRQVDSAQGDYNQAAAAATILGTDTAKKKMGDATNLLADAKANLASWQALKTKAQGDLARTKVSAADYDKAISQDQALVAADQHQITLATMAQTGDNCSH